MAHGVQLVEEVLDVLLQVRRKLHASWTLSYVWGRATAVQVAEMSTDGRVEKMAWLLIFPGSWPENNLWWGGRALLRRRWRAKGFERSGR